MALDAVVLATVFAALVVLGVRPYGLDEPGSIVVTALVVVVNLGLAAICFLKGRILIGVFALFVPLVGLWGAARLGKPSAPWAKRYDEPKLQRSEARFREDRRGARVGRKALDALGGAASRTGPRSRRGRSARRGRRAGRGRSRWSPTRPS